MNPPATEVGQDCIDLAELAVMLDDLGADDVAEVIALFAEETRARLIRFGSGELDASTLLREVHSLKGAASSVCATSLSCAAADLESRLKVGGALEKADLVKLGGLFEKYQAAVVPVLADRA